MSEIHFPILSLIILLPLAGAILISFISHPKLAKWLTLAIASAEIIATLIAVVFFNADTGNNFQLIEHADWILNLNIEYLLGVDGISILFLPASALLTWLTVLASWNSSQLLPRLHFALLLALEGITMGIFCALDMMLFFLFWELTLPIIFFLISLWGIGPKRRSAGIKYFITMLFSGVPLLFGIIILAINHVNYVNGSIPQDLVFSFPVLLETPLPETAQTLIFFLLLLGFAVKTPLVPLHTWLPTAALEGPTQMAALLTGLKLGAYGILRFTMPLAPSAAVEYSWALGIVGAITVIYSALIALQQTNMRRLLAYASISHVGLVIIGLSALNMQGVQGAIFQLLNFSLIAGSLMLIAGFIQHRLGSTEILHLGGLAKVMPRLTALYFIFMLASIAVPGTSGFPAEILLIFSALNSHASIGLTALVGAIFAATYMLSFTKKAFFGVITSQAVQQIRDLKTRELLVLCIPAFLVIWLGFFPNTVLKTNQVAVEAWLSRLLEQPGGEVMEPAETKDNP
jgi:NADH-quinone oxidoreductase subunit M